MIKCVVFDFDYAWEIYKPDHKRSYGPYTLPVLYGDQLVARTDMRHDRKQNVLVVNGVWVESWLDVDDAFAEAFVRGLSRFRDFLGAATIDIQSSKAIPPEPLLSRLAAIAAG